MNKMHSRRKISSVKLTTKFHAKYLGYWFFLTLLLTSGVVLMAFLQQDLWGFVAASGSEFTEQQIVRQNQFVILVMEMLLLVAGLAALAIMTAHRIAGPFLALARTFEAIRAGNLNARLHFRSYDYLDDLGALFNETMDGLQAKSEAREGEQEHLKVVGE